MAQAASDIHPTDLPPLWDYVAPANHRLPSSPVEQTLKDTLAGAWRRLRPGSRSSEPSLTAAGEVDALSDDQLRGLAPPPSWKAASAALDRSLEGWVEHPPAPPHGVITLGAPHSGYAEILGCWAAARGWRLVREPDRDEVLGRCSGWFDELAGDGSPWVLPTLERCFLRHVNGLALVRDLLTRVASGSLGRGVIGCHTWAWAFLQYQWGGPSLPVLVAQAFDAGRMARWLAGLSGDQPVEFNEAGSGRPLWPPGQPEDGPNGDYVRLLAAYSRGIPGVAWATWRRSLVGTARAKPEAGGRVRTVVLVRPWRELRDLAVPQGEVLEASHVLHALLVHGGLPRDALPLVIPLPDQAIAAALSRLDAADLISWRDSTCSVSALGYPAVRHFLAGRGVLTD